MTPEDIDLHKLAIGQLDHTDMAIIHRFAPSEHPFFTVDTGLSKYFNDRFKKLGGMTPEISKLIGWQM
jgi:hypothetical protein